MTRTRCVAAVAALLFAVGCKKEEKPGPQKKQENPPAAQPAPPAAKPAKPGPLGGLLAGGKPQAEGAKGGFGALGEMMGKVAPTAAKPDQAPSRPAAIAEDPGSAPSTPPAPPVTLPPGTAGGDCAATAKRVGAVVVAQMQGQLDGMDAETKQQLVAMMEQQLAEGIAELQKACEQQSWSQTLRDCILTAGDLEAFQVCQRHLPSEATAPTGGDSDDMPDLPTPSTPPPKWDGAASDCDAVAKQLTAFLAWQFSEAAGEEGEAMRAAAAEMTGEIKRTCEGEAWSESVRLCLLRAESLQALERCDP